MKSQDYINSALVQTIGPELTGILEPRASKRRDKFQKNTSLPSHPIPAQPNPAL